jgi:hypothetical protein
MFKLIAPIPFNETTTVLPNPLFGDSEGATSNLNVVRSINGKRRTYTKTKDRRKLIWDFRLTRNKALELFEFYKSYNANQIFVEDHNGRKWFGFIINNPVEIEMARRGTPNRQNWPTGEQVQVTIEFEGKQTEFDFFATRTFESDSLSTIDLLRQNVFMEIDIPLPGSAQHNWDALSIVSADNQALSNWTDLGFAANDLVGTIGDTFDFTLDRTPIYRQSSIVMNNRPGVEFNTVSSPFSSGTAAMQTTSDTQLFSAKSGTIFWVFAHTINAFYTQYLTTGSEEFLRLALADHSFGAGAPGAVTNATEFGMWSLQRNTGLSSEVEQVHISGPNSPFMPINIRFQPSVLPGDTTTVPEIRLVTSATSPIPSMEPIIYCLHREGSRIRFRTNGIEREGTNLLVNNPGYTGKFHVNNQKFVPLFNAKVRGVWSQIMVYPTALRNNDISSIERYLSLRWGIPLGSVNF